jgi:hypothetical protein
MTASESPYQACHPRPCIRDDSTCLRDMPPGDDERAQLSSRSSSAGYMHQGRMALLHYVFVSWRTTLRTRRLLRHEEMIASYMYSQFLPKHRHILQTSSVRAPIANFTPSRPYCGLGSVTFHCSGMSTANPHQGFRRTCTRVLYLYTAERKKTLKRTPAAKR